MIPQPSTPTLPIFAMSAPRSAVKDRRAYESRRANAQKCTVHTGGTTYGEHCSAGRYAWFVEEVIGMKCGSCGHSNREGAKFCGGCGTPLGGPAVCPGCGADTVAGQRFCDSCGQPLAPAASSAQPAAGSVALSAPVGQGRYEVLRFLGEGTR